MKLTVVIPIYNALDELKVLLASINQKFNWQLGEVLLINDASNEETCSFLNDFCQKYPKYTLLNNEENLGFVKTCNRGIRAANGDIVVLLNSDTEIPLEFCERIIKCFESDKNIGVASPISSCSCEYFIPLYKGFTVEQMNERIRSRHKCAYPRVVSAEGFCFCIRKDVVEKQGYLDEVYGKGYHEEVDFSYRSIKNGWKNVLIDDLYVYHKHHASFGLEQREELIAKNNKVFQERWRFFANDYNLKYGLKNPIKGIKLKAFPLIYFKEFIISVSEKIKRTFRLLVITRF